MSDFWRRFIGAGLLIVTMGFSSCLALSQAVVRTIASESIAEMPVPGEQ